MSRRMRIAMSTACALAVVLACILYGSHVRKEAEQQRNETLRRYGGEMVTLPVANRALEAGEIVSAADVSMHDWISSLAPDGALVSLDDVLGREVSVPAAANAPLCELNFRDASQIADIPSGHVAVSVPITEKLGVSAAVAVGSHVVAYRVHEGNAELLGGSAIVLAAPGQSGMATSRGTITVAVTAADVPAILAASTAGDLRLVVPADDVRELEASSTDSTNSRSVAPKSDKKPSSGESALAKDADTPTSEDGQKKEE